MKRARWMAWLLAAALMMAGCAGGEREETGGEVSPSPTGSVPVLVPVSPTPPSPTPTPLPSPTAESLPTPTPTPEPESTPAPPSWEEGRTLDRERPKLTGGLELPINGATGYASVEMGLWSEPLPSEEPTPVESTTPGTEPVPPESAAPSAEPAPTASAAPSVEPAPSVSAAPSVEPAPTVGAAPSVEPAPSESAASSVEPVPTVSAAPSVEPAPSVSAAPSVEPAPSVSAAPSVEPAPSVSAAPSVEPAPSVSAAPSVEPAPSVSAAPSVEPIPTESTAPAEPPDPYEGALAVLEPGTAFTVLQEEGDWWQVSCLGQTGWVEHRYCMVNLPDVIPSMLYDAINSYSAMYVSCGKEIPGVTGRAFYTGKVYNDRLGREEYLMPMLYAAAKKVCAAQQRALAEGNCLKVYEAFRPRSTQLAVIEGLTALTKVDAEVKAGVTTPPWSMTYFINTGYSNHQRGFALDVSLVKVSRTEERRSGGCRYLAVTEYREYEMPTAMHELSMAAASTLGPGNKTLAESMNEPAIGLRGYFTKVGMSPLESEWWHFNDFGARNKDRQSTGEFEITSCLSRAPS